MNKNEKPLSTHEREMLDPRVRKRFEKGYRKFLLTELMISLDEGDEKSVRELAKEIGLHPNAIQNLRSGKTSDIKMTTFLKIISSYGYSLQLVKGRKKMIVSF